MSALPAAEPEVKFVTPKNDAFYAALVYQPLQSPREEIRLLRLHPGQSSDEIRCEIVHNVYLAAQPQAYNALSYCAGDAKVVETIYVQDIEFNVFRNLGLALRRIRQPDEPLLIWIDQICINQKDVREREQQVLLMRKVYSSASRTILWLGQARKAANEGLAISFLLTLVERARSAHMSEHQQYQHALSQLFKIMREQNPEMQVPSDTATNPSSRTLVFNENLVKDQGRFLSNEIKDGRYTEEMAAIGELFGMPWWKRCWVTQEAIVSGSAEVLYGSSNIDMDDLRLVNGILTLAYRDQFLAVGQEPVEDSVRRHMSLPFYESITKLIHLEEKWKTRENLPIREVLNVSRQLESTDPRDRVYAMLGLMDQQYGIVPSYSPSNAAAQTFTTAVKASIQHDGILDVLSDCNEQGRHSELDLPSWVPDYTVPPRRLPMCNWEHNDGKSLFNASLPSETGRSSLGLSAPLPIFLPDAKGRPDRILRCQILNLGSLASENTIGDVPDLNSVAYNSTLEPYLKILAAAGVREIYPSTLPEMPNIPDEPLKGPS